MSIFYPEGNQCKGKTWLRRLLCRLPFVGPPIVDRPVPEEAQGWGIWCGECRACGWQVSDSCRYR
jgi:hypothetical protein